jgi:hypothetical protein
MYSAVDSGVGSTVDSAVDSKMKENQTDKLFKRSSYHVAIAYHIYMAKLKRESCPSADMLDPTYKARMYKE